MTTSRSALGFALASLLALGGCASAVPQADYDMAVSSPSMGVEEYAESAAMEAEGKAGYSSEPDVITTGYLSMSADEPIAEQQAREAGITFIKLDGDIGCMVNGAGLAMATMDVVKLYGGEPANFLDVGGGAGKDKVKAALQIILSDKNVKAVLFNIFGGITRVDEVARGIIAALEEVDTDVPMVARLVGTNEVEGRKLLENSRLIPAATLGEGAQKAVAAAKEYAAR
jgi:succinyl-CoA synthetase beta subunit